MAKEANVYGADGQNVMKLTDAKKVGDQIVMQGKLMDAWESTMYVPPESVVGMMRVFAKRQLLWYMVCLPVYLMRRRGKNNSRDGT